MDFLLETILDDDLSVETILVSFTVSFFYFDKKWLLIASALVMMTIAFFVSGVFNSVISGLCACFMYFVNRERSKLDNRQARS